MTLFASRTIAQHLLRGLVGGVAFVAAVWLFYFGQGWPAMAGVVALGALSVFALRGCPLCWTVGLVETVTHRLRGRTPRNFTCEICPPRR